MSLPTAAITDSTRIQYNKKPGKLSEVKAVKDDKLPNAFMDPYKSGAIHVREGELMGAGTNATPLSEQRAAKPLTNGQAAGGYPKPISSSRPSQARPVPQPTSLPDRAQPTAVDSRRPVPQSAAARQPRPVHAQPTAEVNGINGYGQGRTDSSSSVTRAPPPPPPPPPPAELPTSKKDTYRVLYDFTGQTGPELSLIKDELLEVIRKEGNGKLLSSESFLKLCFRPIFPKPLEFHTLTLRFHPSRMVASPQN